MLKAYYKSLPSQEMQLFEESVFFCDGLNSFYLILSYLILYGRSRSISVPVYLKSPLQCSKHPPQRSVLWTYYVLHSSTSDHSLWWPKQMKWNWKTDFNDDDTKRKFNFTLTHLFYFYMFLVLIKIWEVSFFCPKFKGSEMILSTLFHKDL